MWKNRKFVISAVLVVALVLGCLLGYSDYIQQQIYQEGTENLLETYEQVDKTVMMFAQRNWNVLSDWGSYLRTVADPDTQAVEWRDFDEEKKTWNYSDFYLINADGQYWTVDGRQGVAEHIKKAFEVLYEKNEPVVSNYTASSGVRKIVFTVPVEPIELGGVTYTGLAVSYDNDVLENMVGGGAYNGQSDCYMVYPDGTILMSTEPKTEIPQQMSNLFSYLQENIQMDQKSFNQMLVDIKAGREGSLNYWYAGKNYYLAYQPSDLAGMTIIGIVDRSEVESGMRNVQKTTLLMLSILAGSILIAIVLFVVARSEQRLEQEAQERKMLAHQKELTSQLFNGISRIADRFAIYDLERDEYEYHERRGAPLYPEQGKCGVMLEEMNRRYVILTDSEDAKFSQILNPDEIRKRLKTPEDILRFEYCTRDKSVYMALFVIPVVWGEDGKVSQVILISQDMGRQHELENLANTDGLTGLFNGRYFSQVLKIKEEKQQPFILFYLDLDRFKPINDTYGHDMGDKLLQEVSRRLQGCIRSSDYAFRIGGDEFALIVNGNMDESLRMARIQQIRQAILAPITIEGVTVTVGTSCGSAVYPSESRSTEEIRVLADQRMYEDKEKNHRRA